MDKAGFAVAKNDVCFAVVIAAAFAFTIGAVIAGYRDIGRAADMACVPVPAKMASNTATAHRAVQ